MALFRPAHGLETSKWSICDSLDQSAGLATVVGQNCQTPVYLCVRMSRHLITLHSHPPPLSFAVPSPLFFLYASPFFQCLSSCASQLTSHPFLLLKVFIPRFSVELLRRTQAAALSFASELRETEKKETARREGDMVGRLIHVLIEGFVRGPRQDVRCTSGTFLTLRVSICTHLCPTLQLTGNGKEGGQEVTPHGEENVASASRWMEKWTPPYTHTLLV